MDDIRTGETIARMSEIIAAQKSPVSLVVTGDDLGKQRSCFIRSGLMRDYDDD